MDDDILTFGRTGKASYKAVRKAIKNKPRTTINTVTRLTSTSSSHNSDSSGSSSSYSDDDDEDNGESRRHKRKRKHKSVMQMGGRAGSLASSLIHNKAPALEPCVIDSESEDSDSSLSERKKIKQSNKSPVLPLDDSLSRSPSPQPSPPPPGSTVIQTPCDKKSKRVLNKAANAVNQLICSSYFTPGSEYSVDMNETFTPIGSASRESINLRVRYKGKIHKYTVSKGDPFSSVCKLLASELGVSEGTNFFFTHKTVTIKQTDTPLSLGLSTADIIDAIVTTAAMNMSTGPLDDSLGAHITIKVQSSRKSMVYSLARTDPLQKAMTAFAKELGVDITKLKFSFDGDLISPTQSAEDLDMENDDCIDARVTS